MKVRRTDTRTDHVTFEFFAICGRFCDKGQVRNVFKVLTNELHSQSMCCN